MKIVHILPGIPIKDVVNGIITSVFDLSLCLKSKEIDVEVWGIEHLSENSISRQYPFTVKLFPKTKTRFKLDKDLQKQLDTIELSAIFHLHSVFIPEFYMIVKTLL
jgi:hypothetical protein